MVYQLVILTFDHTSGTAVDGSFTITVVDANTFTYTAAGTLTTSGHILMELLITIHYLNGGKNCRRFRFST